MDESWNDNGYCRYVQLQFIYIHTQISLDTTEIPDLGAIGLHCNNRYIVFFIDLDAILPGTHVQSVILHWYQPNLAVECESTREPLLQIPGKHPEAAASYIPPRPPPNTHHRYVFLLFKQPPQYKFPDCFTHVFPESVSARSGFDIKTFIQAAKLDPPIAMNYFFGRHDPADGESTNSPLSATTTFFHYVNCPASTAGLPY